MRALELRRESQNPRFAAFFYLDISRKLDAVASEADEARFAPMMRARVRELVLHPAEFIDSTSSIELAARKMNEIDAKALFVREGDRIGIITKTDLADAAILRRLPIEAPVATTASIIPNFTMSR